MTIEVTDFSTNRKLIYDFLLVINSNLPPILRRFQVMVNFRYSERGVPHFIALARSDPLQYRHKWYTAKNYEGRPINKLQNSIILLIFKIWKIRNIGFVRNLILNNSCEFYCDDVTVTSFVNDKYGDATAESIP